jgi:DNA polymerase III sliding clamp (beta) subunit (PCNA family)
MIINRNELLCALEAVKPGLTAQETIEQGTCFIFQNGTVSTNNDKVSISYPIQNLDFEGAVKAKELLGILHKFKKDEVELTTNEELLVKCGKAKAGLRFHSEIKNPVPGMPATKWKKLPEDFLRALAFAMGSCGHDNSKPLLTCVHINQEGFIEGTDGFRIAKTMLDYTLPVKTFLIKAEDAANIIKIGAIKITEAEGLVHFKNTEGTVVTCRTFADDTYVNTSQFLKVNGSTFSFPKRTKEILEKAMVFSKRENALLESVEVALSNGSCRIYSESAHGWFEEETALNSYTGEGFTFSIAPYLLKDILSETLSCTISEKLLKFEGENWAYVTMIKPPIRKK